MQACAAGFFRGSDREIVPLFMRHASSEIGHEQLAIDDLKHLGVDTTNIEISQPLPQTAAFTAYGFYVMSRKNPIGYLGYLYFLEYLPTHYGQVFGKALTDAGIPEVAMSFLKDHMSADMGHNKMMKKYISKLVHDEADVNAVISTLKTTAVLYCQLYKSAFDRHLDEIDYGVNYDEQRRLIA